MRKIKLNEKSASLPEALQTKFYSYIYSGVAFIVIGIVLCIIAKSIRIAGFPLLCALALFLLGYSYQYTITKTGYEIITGTVTDYYDGIISRTKDGAMSVLPGRKNVGADQFVLTSEKEVLRVPVDKRRSIPPIGSKVSVYVPKDGSPRTVDGVHVYPAIFGFEILA